MRVYTLLLMVSVLLFSGGCARQGASLTVVSIDGINITLDEFEQAYQNSPYSKSETASSRKDFLENLIARKLILREAERRQIDKDPAFLKDVELFWEQSLLKLTLDKRMQELAAESKVTEREINDYYQAHKDGDFAGRDLTPDVYNQIKWFLAKERQKQAVDNWIDSLKDKTKIRVDYKSLNISGN